MQFEPRRANRTDPPRPERVDDELPIEHRAGNPQRASHNSQDDRFAEQQPADHRHRVPRGAKNPDLPQALLNAQLEEENGQHERRDHQEEAEVGEVLSEVRRPLGRVESRRPRRIEGDAHGVRRERGPQLVAKTCGHRAGIGVVLNRHPNRGQRAVARLPQVTAAFVGDERLRRGAVVVPVALVRGTDTRRDRSGRVGPSPPGCSHR